MYRYLLLTLFISLILSCSEETVITPFKEKTQKEFPEIRDSIPYHKIGTGKLAFQRFGPSENLYQGICVIDAGTKSVWSLKTSCDAPAISPDGEKLAFSEDTDVNAWLLDIHVSSSSGSGKKNISNIYGQDRCPSWSDDSRYVYFWVIDQQTNSHMLFKVKPENTEDKELLYEFYFEKPSTPFSPYGTSLIYSDGGTIYILDSDSIKTVLEVEFDQWGSIYTPRISPDGKQIVFLQAKKKISGSSLVNFGGKIMLYNLENGELKTVYEWLSGEREGERYGFNTLSVCWSPDGKKLAFSKLKEGYEAHIYIVNFDGRGLTQITSEPGVCDRSITWSRY